MAKGRGEKKQSRGPGGARKPLGEAPGEIQVTGGLRALLHRLETRLGLFPADSGFGGHGRFHAPVLLPANEAIPEGMRGIFSEELAALERIGKTDGRCHGAPLKPLKLYCMPYYYYDGFNALLYAERDGKFIAAWREQEMDGEVSPTAIRTGVSHEDLQQVIQQVLEFPA